MAMRGWLVLVVWLWVVAISAQHIRLNMIVKDERRVIERCLRSVRPLIDSWVIVDTGSTDGTQDLIRRLMWEWGMPGRLYEHPWVDFATNRNQALTHALELDAGHADPDSDSDPVDYILFMDADEELVLDPGFQLPCDLDKDFYYILTHYADLRYHRVQLISARVPGWRWQGVVHEAVDSPHAHTHGTLQGVYNQVRPEGSRSTDPDKYRKDAEALFRELVARPHNARTAFYLAQSFRDANDPYNALQWYQKRTHMASAFEEENFYARYQVALLQQQLGFPKEVLVQSYLDAHKYRPTRIEPLFHLGLYYMDQGDYEAGYRVYKTATSVSVPTTTDILFVSSWIYERGRWYNLAVCAFHTQRYEEAARLLLETLNLRP